MLHSIHHLPPHIIREAKNGLGVGALRFTKHALPDGGRELHVVVINHGNARVIPKEVIKGELLHIFELLVHADLGHLYKEIEIESESERGERERRERESERERARTQAGREKDGHRERSL